ncbi:TRAP-type C4-dicarboxylate transport system substrate-binding protein [Tamaricihabitans halophyticus]|uniref:TRAP-type C4-dicarboxylate transport system substrate-binding protein n=2 Tax=Tamaricihabitans halophyticus TaxID=1262583 RepID=A0A4R2QQ65_9PSEU|nr:TRAP-type C4-dicarboxylate transport system substrate-binding protein [Tamaricihabitans halophyticus]
MLGAAAVSAALLATGCAATPSPDVADGVVTLKLAESFPAGHPFAEAGAEFFMARATELSGGAVQFDYFPAEQLGKAADLLSLTRSGVADIAMVAPAYVPAELPLSGVADLPGWTDQSCTSSPAVASMMAEDGVLFAEDFAPKQVRPLAVGVIPGYEVFSGDRVVRTPEEMRGLQLRSSGGAIDRTVRALGAAPVAMPATDMYEAISRGTVDGTALALMSAQPYRLDEVSRGATDGAGLGSWTATYSISERIWRQLPAEIRDVLGRAGQETTRNLCSAIDERNRVAKAEMTEGGLRFHEVSGAQQRSWAAAIEEVPEQWARDMAEIGRSGERALRDYAAALARAER